MRIHGKFPPFFRFSFYCFRLRRSFGVTSKLKSGKHILLFDVDEENKFDVSLLEKYIQKYPMFVYKTPHNGTHVLVYKPQSFIETAKEMLDFKYLDFAWFSIGLRRGYWYLENYKPIPFWNDLTYMEIERNA